MTQVQKLVQEILRRDPKAFGKARGPLLVVARLKSDDEPFLDFQDGPATLEQHLREVRGHLPRYLHAWWGLLGQTSEYVLVYRAVKISPDEVKGVQQDVQHACDDGAGFTHFEILNPADLKPKSAARAA